MLSLTKQYGYSCNLLKLENFGLSSRNHLFHRKKPYLTVRAAKSPYNCSTWSTQASCDRADEWIQSLRRFDFLIFRVMECLLFGYKSVIIAYRLMSKHPRGYLNKKSVTYEEISFRLWLDNIVLPAWSFISARLLLCLLRRVRSRVLSWIVITRKM